MMKKVFALCCILFIGFGVFIGYVVDQKKTQEIEENTRIKEATSMLANMYQDKEKTKPKLTVTEKQINKLKEKIKSIKTEKERGTLFKEFGKLEKFYQVKIELDHCFQDTVLKETVSRKELEELEILMKELSESYQSLLKEKLNAGFQQVTSIETAIDKLNHLFIDGDYKEVRADVSRAEYQDAYQTMEQLSQKGIFNQYKEKFTRVENKIKEREAEEKRKREEELEKQRQLALEKKRKAEEEKRRIEAAYVEIKGIQLINQRTNGVYNGCEAASLLMGLHYKGRALQHNLVSFVNQMPKHESDPHQGFIHSVFDLEPRDVTHWIAPDALSRFGASYGSVQNISGSSVTQIKSYINQQKPVVVYVTSGFKKVTSWYGEVPLNLHVVLLTGYNDLNGNYIVMDPWSGRTIISRQVFESTYNLLKYAVAVL